MGVMRIMGLICLGELMIPMIRMIPIGPIRGRPRRVRHTRMRASFSAACRIHSWSGAA